MSVSASLLSIMNEVASRLDASPITKSSPQEEPRELSEIDAFSLLDPLLADLRKEYMEARHVRKKAEYDFGVDDPMTEIAALSEDSAWCAMQTRYMELRADRLKMFEAQRMVACRQKEIDTRRDAARREKEQEAAAFMDLLWRMQKISKKTMHGADDLLLYYLIVGIPYAGAIVVPTHHYVFNRIAA